jgi:hypothetical protein
MGREARRADTMPTRAVPGINEFIRTLANSYENVTVIDPDALVTGQSSQSDYLDFFVDFLHPSSLGQMTIANEVLHALLPQEQITISPNGGCDAFVVRSSRGERPIAAKMETLKSQVETNLKLLNWFSDRMSTSYMYDFYKKRALAKLENCTAAGSP